MSAKELVDRAKQDALDNFAHAIFPIYRFDAGRDPVHIGTCFGIEHCKRQFLITAAHVIDHQSVGQLALGTTSDNSFVSIVGEWHVSTPDVAGRAEDPIDLAWHQLTDDEIARVPVVESSMIEQNTATTSRGRALTMIGFPRSKNKKVSPKSSNEKRLSPRRAQYTDMEILPIEQFAKRGMSTATHVAMNRDARAIGSDGAEENTIGHIGLSGGPLIFAGLSEDSPPLQPQKVVGVVIEHGDGRGSVIALRMSVVLRLIEDVILRSKTPTN